MKPERIDKKRDRERQEDAESSVRLFDLKTAARYVSLSYWTVRDLYLKGEVAHVRVGRRILIDREDLDDWIESKKGFWH